MLLMPAYSSLLFSILRAPWTSGSRALSAWASDTGEAFLNAHVHAILGLVFLPHQALLSVDAIGRSMLRVFVTKRRLLEWETAAEAEVASRRKATVDSYLEWTPWLTMAIGALLWLVRPEALLVAGPILALWFLSRGISAWLNRPPRLGHRELKMKDKRFLEENAKKMCAFFEDWSSAETNWLIPDNVREDGPAAHRLSPTNLGFLLNARVGAVHLGLLSVPEFVERTKKTLESVLALPKFRGHLLNWYDVRTLTPLEPQFVSTVDSGNLVASLWTLKQAVLEFAAENSWKPGVDAEIAADLNDIAETCEALVRDMDFGFLYHSRKKVLSVGYDVTARLLEPSTYDLLASESRIASFVAIAKGDIPQEAWFHLGRGHTLVGRERVLLSWTGTMFEYLMPALWMRHYPQTVTQQSLEAVVRVQRRYGRRKRIPWGISESGCSSGSGCDYGYAPFGVPELAMKRCEKESLVVSPYSTFLALVVEPHETMWNLHRMAKLGWSGAYGFYEAADFTRGDGEIIRCWMAHHQGMSLLAICNLLYNNPFQRYFHAEPQVLATELLLHERVPSSVLVDVDEETPVPGVVAAAAEA
jgi:cyclic beta-1,2-glucan synthetase